MFFIIQFLLILVSGQVVDDIGVLSLLYHTGNGADHLSGIVFGQDQTVTVSGRTSTINWFLIKFDKNGEILWNHMSSLGGMSWPRYLVQACDGGYFSLGYINDPAHVVIKSNSFGLEEWNGKYDSSNHNADISAIVTPDCDLLVFAQSGALSASNFSVLKINHSNGALLWKQNFGGNDEDLNSQMTLANDGEYLFSGYTKSLGDTANKDFVLGKFREDEPSLTWMYAYGTPGNDEALLKVLELSDGTLVGVGSTSITDMLLVIKFSANGSQVIWCKSVNPVGGHWQTRAELTNDETGIVIFGQTGATDSPSPKVHYIGRFQTSDGSLVFSKKIDTGSSSLSTSGEDMVGGVTKTPIYFMYAATLDYGSNAGFVVNTVDEAGNFCGSTDHSVTVEDYVGLTVTNVDHWTFVERHRFSE